MLDLKYYQEHKKSTLPYFFNYMPFVANPEQIYQSQMCVIKKNRKIINSLYRSKTMDRINVWNW